MTYLPSLTYHDEAVEAWIDQVAELARIGAVAELIHVDGESRGDVVLTEVDTETPDGVPVLVIRAFDSETGEAVGERVRWDLDEISDIRLY